MMATRMTVAALFVLALLGPCGAFLAAPAARPAAASQRAAPLRMALGDPVEVDFTVSGKKITMPGGTPLPQVFSKAGVKIRYNCKQGQCGTCATIIDGRSVRVCSTKLDPFRKTVKVKK